MACWRLVQLAHFGQIVFLLWIRCVFLYNMIVIIVIKRGLFFEFYFFLRTLLNQRNIFNKGGGLARGLSVLFYNKVLLFSFLLLFLLPQIWKWNCFAQSPPVNSIFPLNWFSFPFNIFISYYRVFLIWVCAKID
jgi:hypothetical protein